MVQTQTACPEVVPYEEWRAKRLLLLAHEKELTRHRDRVNAERRRLPMVKIEKDYVFDTREGKRSLKDIFEGRRQLIVYHFMFDPAWEKGCPGCRAYAFALGDLTKLDQWDTSFAFISRAPLAKLTAYKAQEGWNVPWHSSFGNDFNYDFHVTLDENVLPIEYNYRNLAEIEARKGPGLTKGEAHGLSVFFRVEDEVFHTYSAYARGTEGLTDTYSLLDRTPYGRQQTFEDSPPGWPQKPTYG